MLAFFIFLTWLIVSFGGAYLWVIAIAGARTISRSPKTAQFSRFAVAIPAHNEDSVVGYTVATLKQQEYPSDLYDIFVVADNCSDRTAEFARGQGAICYERTSHERSGKGAALGWLFEHIFQEGEYEAVVVFDADTQVDKNFLQVMNDRLQSGVQVVQGRHVISNPREGWFPALAWAMMTIDCRLYSQGRANLGFSARHMGDSICFRSEVLRELGWGSGLTEDYELRLRLLLEGICIAYEPRAVGYGQAPVTWREAQAQRVRWARGVALASRSYRSKLFKEGIRRRDFRLIDGMLSVTIPSYSMLTLLAVALLLVTWLFQPFVPTGLFAACLMLLAGLFFYPFLGLALERAPGWAYGVVLIGPLFMIWRTWINLLARLRAKNIIWIRTPHRVK